MKMKNNNKGITLVALVITIILLLILAGVTISSITSTGLFEKAKEAKRKQEEAQRQEESELALYELEIEKENNPQYSDGSWNENQKVNAPELLTGMIPIKFTEPTSEKEGETVTTSTTDDEWYNYSDKKWANVQTQDGSMWVWIPRFAYKVDGTNQRFDVVFLQGNSDNYYENGELKTAQRQTSADQTIDTTNNYTVHPAFTNESNIGYANGGWDKELPGIWVAKFEAGYASGNNSAPVKSSSVNYSQKNVWANSAETGTGSDGSVTARNWLDKTYGSTTTSIKYPTFQGITYSMNYINHNDAYNISRALTESGNIYGLSNDADSHLMKNSEWGAVAYLAQSTYGLNGQNIYINNVNLSNSTESVYAVTGMSALTENAGQVTTTIDAINNRKLTNAYNWKQINGIKASSTGTIYGIYDMSGGTYERTAGLVANGNGNLTNHGKSLLNNGTKDSTSTKYVTVYPSSDSGETDIDKASQKNYEANTKIYGDGIRETSTAGTGSTSWYKDYSYFPAYDGPFALRGGNLWSGSTAGLFSFNRHNGSSNFYSGFRSVLVAM